MQYHKKWPILPVWAIYPLLETAFYRITVELAAED